MFEHERRAATAPAVSLIVFALAALSVWSGWTGGRDVLFGHWYPFYATALGVTLAVGAWALRSGRSWAPWLLSATLGFDWLLALAMGEATILRSALALGLVAACWW